MSVVVLTALRKVQQEAERLLCERQAAAGQGCRASRTPFLRWRDHDDGMDGEASAAGQGGHMYEVVVWYGV